MPNRECPECKAEVHVRKAACDCGHQFYTPTRRTKEELVDNKEPTVVVKNPAPPAKKVAIVDYADVLRTEAEDLKYSIKEVKTKSKQLQQRFIIFKTINGNKHFGVFNDHGKITGVYQA